MLIVILHDILYVCYIHICVLEPVMQMYSEYYSRFPVWYKSQFECKSVAAVQNAKRPGGELHIFVK